MSELYGLTHSRRPRLLPKWADWRVKARLPVLRMFMLAVLAGAFIALGALLLHRCGADASLGIFRGSPGAWRRGVFAGLLLVIVAGAEPFTGNNLLVMAWADGLIFDPRSVAQLGHRQRRQPGWGRLALLVYLSRHPEMNSGAIGEQLTKQMPF